jgi:hypothetical protein
MTEAIIRPRLLHAIPGRVRLHLAGWSGKDQKLIETNLRAIKGVHAVRVDTLTCNALIHFDCQTTSTATLLSALRDLPTTDPLTNPLSHPKPRPQQLQVVSIGWWGLSQVCLRIAEIVSGVLVIEEIDFLVRCVDAALRIRRILVQRELPALR